MLVIIIHASEVVFCRWLPHTIKPCLRFALWGLLRGSLRGCQWAMEPAYQEFAVIRANMSYLRYIVLVASHHCFP